MEFLTRHVDQGWAPEHPVGNKALSGAASQLFRAMDGIGTDEKSIHRILAGKTEEQIDAIRAIYADHYPGHELDQDLKGELSGNDLAEAQAALTGDPIKQAAAALQNAAGGAGTDEQKLHDTLAQINKLKDPAAREKLAAEFQRISGRSIEAMLRAELGSQPISPKNLQRIQRFVHRYESPAGQERLHAMGLRPAEVAALLSRARSLVEAGWLPRPISLEDVPAMLKQSR